MATKFNFLDLYQEKGEFPFIDVRSPAEFESGHIPGAKSLPLFTNEERAEIGTIYKQVGDKEAIKRGLEIVGPKMKGFIEFAESLNSPMLNMYCWRGGMRSESMAWLLERYGLKVNLVNGGYKGYRNALLEYLTQPFNIFVLTGYTGSKKTHVLHLLRDNGEQVLDLEGLANHQGSSFGNRKSTGQPTTEQFQNHIFFSLLKFDRNKRIWIEDENLKIGQVRVPDPLFEQMARSPHVLLEVARDQRLDFLVEDYGNVPISKLIEATRSIFKRLGNDKSTKAIKFLENGELRQAADIILSYYDKRYQRSIDSKSRLIEKRIKGDLNNLNSIVTELIAAK